MKRIAAAVITVVFAQFVITAANNPLGQWLWRHTEPHRGYPLTSVSVVVLLKGDGL
jgi:hypothetical protein